MSKWRHPYVIKENPGPRPSFHLMALVYGPIKTYSDESIYRKHYRFVESFSSIEKALKAKRKAYERSQK